MVFRLGASLDDAEADRVYSTWGLGSGIASLRAEAAAAQAAGLPETGIEDAIGAHVLHVVRTAVLGRSYAVALDVGIAFMRRQVGVRVYVCVCMDGGHKARLCTHTHTYTHTCSHMHTHTDIHTHMLAYVYTYTHKHTHARTCVHTHTYACTQACMRVFARKRGEHKDLALRGLGFRGQGSGCRVSGLGASTQGQGWWSGFAE